MNKLIVFINDGIKLPLIFHQQKYNCFFAMQGKIRSIT